MQETAQASEDPGHCNVPPPIVGGCGFTGAQGFIRKLLVTSSWRDAVIRIMQLLRDCSCSVTVKFPYGLSGIRRRMIRRCASHTSLDISVKEDGGYSIMSFDGVTPPTGKSDLGIDGSPGEAKWKSGRAERAAPLEHVGLARSRSFARAENKTRAIRLAHEYINGVRPRCLQQRKLPGSRSAASPGRGRSIAPAG